MQFDRPVTITNPDGREIVIKPTAEGLVITDGASSIIIGYDKNQLLGVQVADSSSTHRILLGMAPDDGRVGLWISKEGEDVVALLGG